MLPNPFLLKQDRALRGQFNGRRDQDEYRRKDDDGDNTSHNVDGAFRNPRHLSCVIALEQVRVKFSVDQTVAA